MLTGLTVLLCPQETVSAGTTSTILRGLKPNTLYSVSLVPVYAGGDGKTMSENGKTSEASTMKSLQTSSMQIFRHAKTILSTRANYNAL